MKKQKKLCCALALAMTLAMLASSGFASGGIQQDNSAGNVQALMNGQTGNNGMMTATNTGGTPPTEIVVGQTNLQIQPATGNFTGIINIHSPALTVNNAQDASVAGSGAQLVTVKTLAKKGSSSSGGNSFHAGKYFASSFAVAGMMTSSIAT